MAYSTSYSYSGTHYSFTMTPGEVSTSGTSTCEAYVSYAAYETMYNSTTSYTNSSGYNSTMTASTTAECKSSVTTFKPSGYASTRVSGNSVYGTGNASYNVTVDNASWPALSISTSKVFTGVIHSVTSSELFKTIGSSVSSTRASYINPYDQVTYSSIIKISLGVDMTSYVVTNKSTLTSRSYTSDVAQLAGSSSSSSSTYLDDESAFRYSTQTYSTYTITSGQISFTRQSGKSSSIGISDAGLYNYESTYTSLDIAQTVIDSSQYTYRTTFYGTINKELSGITLKSDTSWINIAQVEGSSYTNQGVRSVSLTAGTSVYGSSSFGVDGYGMLTTYVHYEKSSLLNNPVCLAKPIIYSSSTMSSSEIKAGPFSSLYTTYSTRSRSYSQYTLKDVAANIRVQGSDFYYVENILTNTTFSEYQGYKSSTVTSSSSTVNTMDYGTTARISDMTSSSSWANIFSSYLINNSAFSYNVSSIWIYNTITSTLSEYSTVLVTQFSNPYNQNVEYKSVSYTQSYSTVVVTTEDRFINKKAISRFDTNVISYTNTVAEYNGQTMATLSQSSTTMTYNSSVSTSRITYTFISNTADFSSSQSVITTGTLSSAGQKFINSLSSVMNSTSEQQNDTLIFQSTVATISTYNVSSSYTTISTMQVDYEATTYTDEYNPKAYSSSNTMVSTSLNVGSTLSSTSNTVQVTQSVGYTPIYSSVNGIYVTTE